MIDILRIKRILSFMVMGVIPALMIGCSEQGSVTSFEQDKSEATARVDNIASKRIKSMDLSATVEFLDQPIYPQSESCLVTFKKSRNIYNGAAFELPNKSSFSFSNGALIPPPDHSWGETVTITMMADKDLLTNEIIFTFGPSGCTFETPAEVWLNWSDLDTPNARLYYLDKDGNRLEELPEQIDVYNRQMCIRIEHFSRYALAYSN